MEPTIKTEMVYFADFIFLIACAFIVNTNNNKTNFNFISQQEKEKKQILKYRNEVYKIDLQKSPLI